MGGKLLMEGFIRKILEYAGIGMGQGFFLNLGRNGVW